MAVTMTVTMTKKYGTMPLLKTQRPNVFLLGFSRYIYSSWEMKKFPFLETKKQTKSIKRKTITKVDILGPDSSHITFE